MESLESFQRLKNAILCKHDISAPLEEAYADFLSEYSPQRGNILANLLKMVEPTPRIEEIQKVINFVRFPVKKSITQELIK